MRPKERIKPFLEQINWENAVQIMFPEFTDDVKEEIVARIYKNLQEIKTTWNENPDWRITQVLVNTGMVPNYPGLWYYLEDAHFLISQGLEPRKVLLWGQNYDKDMNLLPKTNWILICDLNTDHIKAILDGNHTNSSTYIEAFKAELKHRKSLTE